MQQDHATNARSVEPPFKLERTSEVLARIGVARSTLWLYISKGTFPAPLRLSPHRLAWVSSEVDGWLQERLDARRT